MDSAQLRATQAPIKERYKSDPKAAVITLTARGSVDDDGIACKVDRPCLGGGGAASRNGRHRA
jgi:hypothetical protein